MSTLEALLPLFEPETLARLTSKKAFAAGQELALANRTVTDIVLDGGHLRGKVKGSHPMPHQTGLKLQPDGTLEASCSCPTYTDGWEKICQHAVALALTLRKQYQTGADITRTQNPWVQDLGSGSSASNHQRYQVEVRKVRPLGTRVAQGEPLLRVHAARRADAQAACARLHAAITIGDAAPPPIGAVVIERIAPG